MAGPSFGTLTTFDTLAASQQTIAQFGEDKAWDAVAEFLEAYNRQVHELLTDFVDRTTIRLRRYGTVAQMQMQKMDELGSPNVQKIKAGAPLGHPLENYQIGIGWTRMFMKVKKAAEFAGQIQEATRADMANLIKQIKIALFNPTNYSFDDYLVDHQDIITLPIKALINADGSLVPPSPDGITFDGATHNHYLAVSALTNTWAVSLVETVAEHFNEGNEYIFINKADEASWRALADFKPYVDSRIIPAVTQDVGQAKLDIHKLYNRAIGVFRNAEVWVKPWAVANYAICWMQGVGQPLAMRVRGENVNGGTAIDGAGEFGVVYEDEEYPLRARFMEREFGISVYNRVAAAIGYFGGSSYVAPTIS